MMDYLKFSKNREKEANKILMETNLFSLLRRFGKVKRIGSYSLGLMIKPDIDFVVKVKNYSDIQKTIKEILKLYKQIPKLKLKKIVDRNNLGLKGKSIHFEYPDNDVWGIDVLVSTNDFRAYEKLKAKVNNKITPQKKKIILNLKYHFFKKKDKVKNTSYPIYISVLDGKVKNIKDFYKYLEV